MKTERKELLKPKYDIVFQILFGSNKENITQSFISDILGKPYTSLNKTIGIIITNYEVKELKGIEDLDTTWQIMETKNGKKLLTEDLELRIIELSKAEKALQKDNYNRLAQWLAFLDNPNTERVEEIMKENEEIKKAQTVLHEMSENEKLQRWAELKEKWEHDEVSAREYYKETGYKEGLEKGIEKGIEEKQLEIAKKMKDENLDIDMIIKITGLTKETIENL